MKKILFSFIAMTSLLFTNLIAESFQSQLEEKMREKISILGPENSFTYVDLELTSEELSLLDRLQFDKILLGAATSYE